MSENKIIENVSIVELVEGIGKESKKPYTAIKVTIGEYESDLIFFKSKLEEKYVTSILKDGKKPF